MKKLIAVLFMLFLIQNAYALSIFSLNNKYGLKDDLGNIILDTNYQKIIQMEYIPQRTILIPMQATNEVETIKSDYYKIQKNNLWGVSNKDGKIIHNCEYQDIKLNDNGEIVLINNGEETLANPVKNSMKSTKKTFEAIVGLPVTIVAGVLMPIEIISKIGQR